MIIDEQNVTVMDDIHVIDMENEDKGSDIIIPDLNSSITIKDINGDYNMSGKLCFIKIEILNSIFTNLLYNI